MESGFYLINKDENMTSRDVCDKVQRKFHFSKVGHIGTLDPFATGLMLVMVNKATKCAPFFDDFDKKYIATLSLGVSTDSLDKTGKTLIEEEINKVTKEQVVEVLNSFLGHSIQMVPMTSAVHVNGKKLYDLAHHGIKINDRPTRKIEVLDIKLLEFDGKNIKFYVHVSKGTYIRVLAVDIAERLNNIGHLVSLERVAVGPFSLELAKRIDDLEISDLYKEKDILEKFVETESVDDALALDIKNGKIKYYPKTISGDKLLILNNNEVLAMYIKDANGNLEFKRGLF